jgi:predicted lipoprotein with Yx(FWY)xxD motif
MKALIAFVMFAGILAVTGCASTPGEGEIPPAPARFMDGVMVNAAGMTLYTFDKDPVGAGKSVCNGPCAKNWPPLMAGPDAKGRGEFSVVSRDDGTKQWAHDGKPLYLWIKDAKPGDKTGEGFNKVWWTIKK